MVDNSSSFGSLHVRPMGVHRTCGEPTEARNNTHPTNTTALLRGQDYGVEWYLAYMLYAPLHAAGPIITFNSFAACVKGNGVTMATRDKCMYVACQHACRPAECVRAWFEWGGTLL